MAHGDITVVAAQEDLIALGDDITVRTDAGIRGRLAAAVTDGLDFSDGVGQFKQPPAAGEQLCLEICPQSKAQNRQIFTIDQFTQLVDLLTGQELTLIDNDHIRLTVRGIALPQIALRSDCLALRRQSNARSQGELSVAPVGSRLDQPNAHAALFVVIFGNERCCRFARAHCAVFKVQLCHILIPSFMGFWLLYQIFSPFGRGISRFSLSSSLR